MPYHRDRFMGYIQFMTTTRKKTPDPENIGIDLATFCAQMDEHTGRDPGTVLRAVVTYRHNSDLVALTSSRSAARTELTAKLDRIIEIGHARIGSEVITAVRRGGGARMALRSEDVAKAHPQLWKASRPMTRVAVVKSPRERRALAIGPTNTAEQMWAVLQQLKHSNTEATKLVEAAREELRAVFDEVADTWPGDPKATTDGWVLGWNPQQRFNETVCRELAAAEGIDLSPLETVATISARVSYELVAAVELDAADAGGD